MVQLSAPTTYGAVIRQAREALRCVCDMCGWMIDWAGQWAGAYVGGRAHGLGGFGCMCGDGVDQLPIICHAHRWHSSKLQSMFKFVLIKTIKLFSKIIMALEKYFNLKYFSDA